jgi:hypothetical protein
LAKYAKALGHDFSDEIPGMPSLELSEPEPTYLTRPKTLAEALGHIEYWRNKYVAILEKYVVEKEKNEK